MNSQFRYALAYGSNITRQAERQAPDARNHHTTHCCIRQAVEPCGESGQGPYREHGLNVIERLQWVKPS